MKGHLYEEIQFVWSEYSIILFYKHTVSKTIFHQTLAKSKL